MKKCPPWNQQLSSENGWLENDRFLLGPGLFSRLWLLVSGKITAIQSWYPSISQNPLSSGGIAVISNLPRSIQPKIWKNFPRFPPREVRPDMVSHTSDYFDQLQTAMEDDCTTNRDAGGSQKLEFDSEIGFYILYVYIFIYTQFCLCIKKAFRMSFVDWSGSVGFWSPESCPAGFLTSSSSLKTYIQETPTKGTADSALLISGRASFLVPSAPGCNGLDGADKTDQELIKKGKAYVDDTDQDTMRFQPRFDPSKMKVMRKPETWDSKKKQHQLEGGGWSIVFGACRSSCKMFLGCSPSKGGKLGVSSHRTGISNLKNMRFLWWLLLGGEHPVGATSQKDDYLTKRQCVPNTQTIETTFNRPQSSHVPQEISKWYMTPEKTSNFFHSIHHFRAERDKGTESKCRKQWSPQTAPNAEWSPMHFYSEF